MHTTYLVRADAIPELSYEDGPSARIRRVLRHRAQGGRSAIIDNRQVYGYIVFDVGPRSARAGRRLNWRGPISKADLAASPAARCGLATPRLFGCFGPARQRLDLDVQSRPRNLRAAGVPFLSTIAISRPTCRGTPRARRCSSTAQNR